MRSHITVCEEHVEQVLQESGAESVSADFRREEALFEMADSVEEEAVKCAVVNIGYTPGRMTVISGAPGAMDAEKRCEYDLLIIGSGGAAPAGPPVSRRAHHL